MEAKTASEYSTLSKLFHWIIALAVIIMLIAGFFLDEIPEQFQGLLICFINQQELLSFS
ncbi:hypothetical protein PGH43_07075 [Legionella pneumophila 130b]|nr:hypothetical protein PGH43_07075 [Legionella pneumophila 130b]WBV67450.1 hypothetical protein PGH44_07095 [Legionella pneumophila]